jgi:proton glutamate symport protein
MSLTVRVLIGLVSGLVVGFVINASPDLRVALPWIEPAGSIFINAIRMTVVPLVVASLVVGVAGAPDARAIGRVGWRALVLFIVIVLVGAVFGALIAQPILTRMIDPASTVALRAGASALAGAAQEGAQRLPTFVQWLIDLVPSNPIRAAADGAMLPLIVFSLLFGVALLRLDVERRRPIISFFEGVAEAMLVLVRWVLVLAPIGVFALAVPLAARMGLAAAGALIGFVILVSSVSVAFMALVLYPSASVVGRVPLGAFARAIAPAQAVAFSSRSSLAALPAMIEAAETRLHFPPDISRFL